MIQALGQFIKTVSDSVGSAGVLVFFPSYSFMENCKMIWKKCKIYFKQNLVDEPKNNTLLDKMMENHRDLCKPNKGG